MDTIYLQRTLNLLNNMMQKHKAEEEAKKQAEIEALQKQLNELKQLTAAKVFP